MIEISPERRGAIDFFDEEDGVFVLVEEDGLVLPQDVLESPPELPEGENDIVLDEIGDEDELPSNFDLYSRDISRYERLKEEEEKSLGLKIEQGRVAERELREGLLDAEQEEWLIGKLEEAKRAKRDLYTANLALPIWAAKRWFLDKDVPILDLVQEGNIILLTKAVEKFNWRLGSFANYATWWLKNAMDRAITDQIYPLNVSVSGALEKGRILQITDSVRQVLGRRPRVEEVAEEARVDKEEIKLLMTRIKKGLSLDAENGREDEILGERIPDLDVVSPPEAAFANQRAEIVDEELKELPPRTCRMLVLRFGFEDGHVRTNGEVGQEFGLTRERVRQIFDDADGAFPTLAQSKRLKALL